MPTRNLNTTYPANVGASAQPSVNTVNMAYKAVSRCDLTKLATSSIRVANRETTYKSSYHHPFSTIILRQWSKDQWSQNISDQVDADGEYQLILIVVMEVVGDLHWGATGDRRPDSGVDDQYHTNDDDEHLLLRAPIVRVFGVAVGERNYSP